MQYEIDYIPVGTGEKGGDAIVFRYGDFSSAQTQNVVVIDGGTKDSGKKLVEHIKKHYATTFVDVVVASHLHSDHISGLSEVLENLNVGQLVIHTPWDHTDAIKKMTHADINHTAIQTKLEKSLSMLSDLVDLASSKQIPIVNKFQGDHIIENQLIVLGPSKEYYQQLLANFGVTPEVKAEHRIDQFVSFGKSAVNWLAESLDIETLKDDDPDTDHENNSSLILLLALKDDTGVIKRFLFTGDAGKAALLNAIGYCEAQNYSLEGIDFFDVPHHGSKKNLSPTILNKLKPKVAFISCPPEGHPKHPSGKVVNALRRRGCNPFTNKAAAICHKSPNAPQRDGYSALDPEPFHDQVAE